MGLLRALAKSLARRNVAESSDDRAKGKADAGAARRSARGADYSAARERIVAHPDDAEAWALAARTLMHWGRRHEAFDAFESARRHAPASAEIARDAASCAWALGRTGEAERALREAIAARDDPPTALALSRLLASSGRAPEALRLATRALASGADRVEGLATVARCERALGDIAAAERHVREAIDAAPADARLWRDLASLLESAGREVEAEAAQDRARALGDAGTYIRAERLRRRGDYAAEAALLIDELRERPSAAGQFMLAEALIAQGRFLAGWRQFEFRKFERAMLDAPGVAGVPPWLGQPLRGKTILVKAEQGIGDVAWFARYLPRLAGEGARVVLLPRADMQRASRGFAGVDRVLSEGERLPALDYQVSLMSLAMRFSTTLASIPGGVPYLVPDRIAVERWERVIPDEGLPRVGIVWAGKPAQARDAQRSMQLTQFLPILRVPGCRFFSLQKGPAEAQIADLPGDVALEPLGARFDDLEDLLGAIARMDLVISVCTGPAHIAGAMGKPVWTLISEPPDMRWMQSRTDSPWYPTMRLFRQSSVGRWDDVVANVAAALGTGREALDATSRGDHRSRNTVDVDDDGSDDDALARVAETSVGVLMVDEDEALAGDGAYLLSRLHALTGLAARGDIVLTIGVAADAIALGRGVGASGHLFLHEADARRCAMLVQNLTAHGIANASVLAHGLRGASDTSEADNADTIDDLALDRLDGLVIELAHDTCGILAGADATVWRSRPWLAITTREADATKAAERAHSFGYRTFRLDAEAVVNAGVDGVVVLFALPEERMPDDAIAGCVEWP
ncbi:MAG TPA: hypothetical protein VII68_04990 [Casimicrobiaceae bacterium]